MWSAFLLPRIGTAITVGCADCVCAIGFSRKVLIQNYRKSVHACTNRGEILSFSVGSVRYRCGPAPLIDLYNVFFLVCLLHYYELNVYQNLLRCVCGLNDLIKGACKFPVCGGFCFFLSRHLRVAAARFLNGHDRVFDYRAQ